VHWLFISTSQEIASSPDIRRPFHWVRRTIPSHFPISYLADTQPTYTKTMFTYTEDSHVYENRKTRLYEFKVIFFMLLLQAALHAFRQSYTNMYIIILVSSIIT